MEVSAMNSSVNYAGLFDLYCVAREDDAADENDPGNEQTSAVKRPVPPPDNEADRQRVRPAPVAQLIIDGWEEPEGRDQRR
jgi:hypothetical protein